MGKPTFRVKLFFIFSVLLITFTIYNCGGGDENSSTNSFTELSQINGRVTDVLLVNGTGPDVNVINKLARFFEFIKEANAQGILGGITVIALQMEGGEEVFVDEDITDDAGGFTLNVPAGMIILQFIIGDDMFEHSLDVPEETTLEIFVNINADDPVNPVEVTDIFESEDDSEDDSQSGNTDGDDDDDDQSGDDGAQTGDDDDDDDGQGSGDGGQTGDDDDDDSGQGGSDGGQTGDDDDDSGQGGSDGGQTGDDDDDGGGQGGSDGGQTGDDDDDDTGGNDGGSDPPPSGNGEITSSAMVSSINSRRSQGADCGSEGVFGATTPLSVNSALGQAALRHSDDMANLDFFSHIGSDGSNPVQRMNDAGFNGNAWGENISRSTVSRTAEQVVAGWMTSDGHCANIMSPGFSKMGSAVSSSSSWEYWTLNLGN